MVLGDWEYQAMHIPGSLRINTFEEGLEALDPEDDIVIYDSGPDCAVSRRDYKILKYHGYGHVRCYAGGLEEWVRAGHPLEGAGVRRV
ncbi:MAG TPA: rhodanese-like domain-containing protein [Rubrobacter sp.]|nr:rhodanese-like domain-containing protein [Rubrobacter sp.]